MLHVQFDCFVYDPLNFQLYVTECFVCSTRPVIRHCVLYVAQDQLYVTECVLYVAQDQLYVTEYVLCVSQDQVRSDVSVTKSQRFLSI